MPTTESGGVRLHYEVSGNRGWDSPSWFLPIRLDRTCTCGTRCCRLSRAATEYCATTCVVTERAAFRRNRSPSSNWARDVLRLLDAVGGGSRALSVDLSLGGMVALWLGIHAPSALASVDPCEHGGAHRHARRCGSKESRQCATTGMAPLAVATIERWFTPVSRAAPRGDGADPRR